MFCEEQEGDSRHCKCRLDSIVTVESRTSSY